MWRRQLGPALIEYNRLNRCDGVLHPTVEFSERHSCRIRFADGGSSERDANSADGHAGTTAAADRGAVDVRGAREPVRVQLLRWLADLFTAGRHLLVHRVHRKLLERPRLRHPVSRWHVREVRRDPGFMLVSWRQRPPVVRPLGLLEVAEMPAIPEFRNRYVRFVSPRTNEVMLEVRREEEGLDVRGTSMASVQVNLLGDELHMTGTIRDAHGDVMRLHADGREEVFVGFPVVVGPISEADQPSAR